MFIGDALRGSMVGYGPYTRFGAGIPRLIEDHPLATNLVSFVLPLALNQPRVFDVVNRRYSDGGGGGNAYPAVFTRSSTNADAPRRYEALSAEQHYIPDTGPMLSRLKRPTTRFTISALVAVNGGVGGTSNPHLIGYVNNGNYQYSLYRSYPDDNVMAVAYYNGTQRGAKSASNYFQSSSSFQPLPNHFIVAVDIAGGAMDCYYNGAFKERVTGLDTTPLSYAGSGGIYYAGNGFGSNGLGGSQYFGAIWADVFDAARVKDHYNNPFELIEEESTVSYFYYKPAAPSGISGVAAITFAGMTASGAGTVAVAGVLAGSMAGMSLATTATVDVKGTFGGSFAGMTASGAGVVDVAGVVAITFAGMSVVSTGTVVSGVAGDLSATFSGMSLAATATVDIKGTFGGTLAGMTASGAGTVDVKGVLAITFDGMSTSSAGTVAVAATLGATLAGMSLVADGVVTAGALVFGTLAATFDGMTLAATGTVTGEGYRAPATGGLPDHRPIVGGRRRKKYLEDIDNLARDEAKRAADVLAVTREALRVPTVGAVEPPAVAEDRPLVFRLPERVEAPRKIAAKAPEMPAPQAVRDDDDAIVALLLS